MHIQSYISKSGFCSRRESARMAHAGRITINGEVCDSKARVEQGDEVRIDGNLLPAPPPPVYLAFNKPRGITCTAQSSIEGNIIDFIDYHERIFPVGRLDKDSEGLILLTNDGSIVNPLLKKEFSKEKEYMVTVNRPITPLLVEGIQQGGISIRGKMTSPCKAVQIDDFTMSITLTQGLNRQIRRMCRTYDFTVQSLKRIRIGSLLLDDLPSGRLRELSRKELDQLLKVDGTLH
ncbi:pseudouridine synthase [Jeotgalibacillus proteolyticus]|uniref:Pseudouridine synthase n=1 Tax=Jeotgalibacillus proteolyticus TaxID=2082395 RepID=A0A2S5GA40_9BACL|nr:pseudouridine synthase [Jeotgalibacillus proteolyticus]PPA69849.1 23S rRNA pseudouridine synthase F [Jeotgalibacillus proteolyticus]